MKGKRWYQASDVAEEYESKRFSGGGRLIDRREREAVLDALAPVAEKRILEIACGTGRFSVMLADRGAEVVGIDISTPMLQQGRRKAERTGVCDAVEFMRGDAARIPVPDDSFDAVFAMRFFHLAPTPRRFLEEMRRVSREIIFFDTFNSPSSRTVYNWLLPMGSRLYHESDVHDLVAFTNLELVNQDRDFVLPYGCYRSIPGTVARPLRQVDERIGGTDIGSQFASVSFWTVRENTDGKSGDA